MKKIEKKFVLPTHCMACGVYLMGGATIHKQDCTVRKLIEEHFPRTKVAAKEP